MHSVWLVHIWLTVHVYCALLSAHTNYIVPLHTNYTVVKRTPVSTVTIYIARALCTCACNESAQCPGSCGDSECYLYISSTLRTCSTIEVCSNSEIGCIGADWRVVMPPTMLPLRILHM